MAKGGVVTEEKVISCAQYLDLIYTQYGTLYEKIPYAPWSNFNVPPQIKDSHARDGLIGTTNKHHATTSDPAPTSQINVMSFDKGKSEKQPGSKKKGKSKKNKILPCRNDHLINKLETIENILTLE